MICLPIQIESQRLAAFLKMFNKIPVYHDFKNLYKLIPFWKVLVFVYNNV